MLLFGAVQITMFGFAWYQGERFSARVLLGMLIAFAGLLILLLPGSEAPPLASALLMAAAGVAWGVYSLLGKGSPRPLADTAGNFARSLPCLVLLAPMLLLGAGLQLTRLACCMPCALVCWPRRRAMPCGTAWCGRLAPSRRQPCS